MTPTNTIVLHTFRPRFSRPFPGGHFSLFSKFRRPLKIAIHGRGKLAMIVCPQARVNQGAHSPITRNIKKGLKRNSGQVTVAMMESRAVLKKVKHNRVFHLTPAASVLNTNSEVCTASLILKHTLVKCDFANEAPPHDNHIISLPRNTHARSAQTSMHAHCVTFVIILQYQ